MSIKGAGILPGIVAFFVVFGIYLIWPSYSYANDSLQAAMAIQQTVTGDQYYHPSGERLFEPGIIEQPHEQNPQIINNRYYLDYPTSTLIYRVWELLGHNGLIITPLLLSRAVAGSIGVFFFALTCFAITRHYASALLLALGLGITATYWTFSTDMYQTINMAAFVCIALWLMIRQIQAKREGYRFGDKASLALMLALATLYNIMAIFTASIFVAAVGTIPAQHRWLERLKRMVYFGLLYAGFTICILIFVSTILGPTTGQQNVLSWSSNSNETHKEFSFDFDPIYNGVRTFLGYARAYVVFPGAPVRDFQGFRDFWDGSNEIQKVTIVGFYIIVLTIATLPVIFIFWQRQRLETGYRRLLVLMLLWFMLYAGFNWIWNPNRVDYWIVPMIIWWLTLAFALMVIQKSWPGRFMHSITFVGFIIALIFGTNLYSQFVPESDPNNSSIKIAKEIGETATNSLFVSLGHPLDFYIAYFSHRDILSLEVINTATNDDVQRTRAIVDTQVKLHRADGGDVFVYAATDEQLVEVAQIVGLDGKDDLEVALEFPDLTIYKAMYPE